MEASPLTRQLPPEVFTPKIIQLYDFLFKVRFLFRLAIRRAPFR
jgi:hypothetical protein